MFLKLLKYIYFIAILNLKRKILRNNNRNDSYYSSVRKYGSLRSNIGSIRMSDLRRVTNDDSNFKKRRTKSFNDYY